MTLEITNTIVNKEGRLIDNDITYEVNYIVANNQLASVQCSISQNKAEGMIPLGYIKKENERINTDFEADADIQNFLSMFSMILQEIEYELSGSATVESKKK